MLIAKSKYSVAEIIGVSAVDSMLIRNLRVSGSTTK